MNTLRFLCLLFLFTPAGQWSGAALSPVPVVEITKVNLPKVEIRIINPSTTQACIIWRPGMSWEEQNKWFSLRTAAGEKVWELHPVPRAYTRNFPAPQAIPPGQSVECKYNLADKSWAIPKDFAAGGWKYEIQAHLQIPRDVESHRFGVFTGHVTSAWHGPNGGVAGNADPPQQDAKHAAIETRDDFPMSRLIMRLEQLTTGTPPDKESLGTFIGTSFPWDSLEGTYEGTQAVVILLPNQQLLRFQFYADIHGAAKAGPRWRRATELLSTRTPRMKSIVVTRTGEGLPRFRRAFDEKGRIDPKETENLSR